MKNESKKINEIITRKFNDFVNAISDDNVKNLVKNNSIVTGGCIASLFLNEKVKDFDIYFKNKETVKAVSKYYIELYNKEYSTHLEVIDGQELSDKELEAISSGYTSGYRFNINKDRIKIINKETPFQIVEDAEDEENYNEDAQSKNIKKENKKYFPVYITSNAISLTKDVQLIIRFYGTPEEIHDNYDFVHATNYWDSEKRELILKEKALKSLLEKNLYYIGSKYPLSSIIRTKKFIERGWKITAGEYLKMIYQVSKLNLDNPLVLEEQLTGVDVVYFNVLINELHNISKNESINYNILVELIDKIFN